MRGIGLTIFILLIKSSFASVFFSADTLTQKKSPENPMQYSSVVKTNMLPMIWGPIPFTAEYRIIQEVTVASHQSAQLGVSYLGKSFLLKIQEDRMNKQSKPYTVSFRVSGFRLQVSHKFYFARRKYAPMGWYVSPHLSYATARLSDRFSYQYNVYIRASQFNINLLFGRQRIKRNRLSWDYFWGIGYKKNTWYLHYAPTNIVPINIKDIPFYGSGLKLSFGFNMGYAF